MNTLNQHFKSSLIYLLIIAVLGFLLRNFLADLLPLSFLKDYQFTLHAHSHVALLCWAYIGITTLLSGIFLPLNIIKKPYYRLFIAINLTIIGMLISFPIQGYASFSILFSSLFLIGTYIFWYCIIKFTTKEKKQLFAFQIMKNALFYMGISSIGPWALGIIVTILGKTSIWYKLAIYFYLHFQYNAWFLLAFLAIIFYIIENKGFLIQLKFKKAFLLCINSGIILSFFLSTLWANDSAINYWISNLGNVLQISGIVLFMGMIRKPALSILSRLSSVQKAILRLITVLFSLKLLFQLANGLPIFNNLISHNRDLIIAYLHWYFLGVITPLLLLLGNYFNLIKLPKWPMLIYAIAFFSSEFFIAYRAGIPVFELSYFAQLNNWMTISSGLFMLSIAMILIHQFKKS